jgi:polysaccharide export outer membrane protein
MHDPQVTVFVTEHKSQRIYLGGAVKNPGPHELVGRVRLADALAMAGGLTDDAGRSVQLVRKRADTGTPVTTVIELDKLASADEEANPEIQGGDVIDVARAGAYYVGGEVGRPGSFFLKTRTTVAQAVVNAGGVKDVADWDDVRLYRRRPDGSTDIQTFSLNEIESGLPAAELQADDVVVVGKSGTKAFLYGVRDFFRFGIGASLPIL